MSDLANMPTLAPSFSAGAPRRMDRPAGRAQRSHIAPTLQVAWARHLDDVRAAQRLRHDVFTDEMGARPTPLPGAPACHDIDLFDDFCEHLIVRTAPHNDEPGSVVGACRVLTPGAARRAGSFHSDTEFDLTRLRPLREHMVELGRGCVHPEHRSGAVIPALWGAVFQFMERHAMKAAIGCASISVQDGGHGAASLWARLQATHLVPVDLQVRPREALPIDDLDQSLDVQPPALIKGSLRAGAKVLGAPAWNPQFNTAHLPLLTRVDDIPDRYRHHLPR